MASVWKRLQRVNKRAAKFQFTASYHELRLETTAKWRPSSLSVVWTRRSRRVASAPLPWEPDMMNPLVGQIIWPVPDNHPISVTLFKDPRTHELEDKDWTFVIEDITPLGKKRVLANASINMRKYASIESTQQSFTLTLKPVSRKITAAQLELTISCVFLREGKATDEDMQSVVSFMSVNNNCDVAPLDDLEDMPDLENDISDNLFDFTQQLEQMTTSLNGCIDVPTPLSADKLDEQEEVRSEEQKQERRQLQTSKSSSEGNEVSLKTPKGNPITEAITAVKQDGRKQQQQQQQPTVASKSKLDFLQFSKALTSTPIKKEEEVKEQGGTRQQKTTEDCNFSKSSSSTLTATVVVNDSVSLEKEEKSDTERTAATVELMTTTVGGKLKESNSKNNSNNESKTQQSVDATIKSNTTTTTAKRAELTPLKLKKSYEQSVPVPVPVPVLLPITNGHNNSSSNNSNSNQETAESNMLLLRPIEKIVLKENTPGQDLLEWCKEVTKDYPNVKVTNLTTSWRNGMAFCAIINHFTPHLIDMSKLTAHDVVGNCRTAFDAAETLGIPRVIEPRDMSLLAVPDKLAVMTYLHQLRAHFTGKQLQIEQIGSTSDESSYVIGNYKSDNLSQNLMQLSHFKAQLLHQNSIDDYHNQQQQQQQQQNNACSESLSLSLSLSASTAAALKKDNMKNVLISNSKNIIGKVLSSPTIKDNNKYASPTSNGGQLTPKYAVEKHVEIKTPTALALHNNDNNQQQQQHQEQHHHRQDKEEVEPSSPTANTTSLDSNKTNKILTRHKEMSEKARMMMERLQLSYGERSEHDEQRQLRLREQARRLILETRSKSNAGTPITLNGSSGSLLLDSPTSPNKPKRISYTPERTISPINNGVAGDDESSVFTFQMEPAAVKSTPQLQLQPQPTSTTSTTTTIKTSSNILTKQINNNNKNNNNNINNNTNTNNLSKTTTTTSPSHRLSERFKVTVENSGGKLSPLQSFNAVMERISPKNEKQRGDKLSYIESELEALEREQVAIDQKASNLEEKLRAVMAGNPKTEETEEQLLSQWFTLVNKKNALLRRQMQLNILEQESDLERKYTLLNQELRAAQSVEDWRKTEAQREKERLLLEELVAIVDKRDQLVQHLHNQEIAIEDDHEIARELEQVDISGHKEKCVIQ